MSDRPTELMSVHARLFPDDVDEIKRRAALHGVPWHIELRLLVRRAVKEAQLGIIELSVEPKKGKKNG